MNKEELYSRLDELSWTDSVLDALDASQWRFWRRKKQLNEAQMFPLVREYIELRSKKLKDKGTVLLSFFGVADLGVIYIVIIRLFYDSVK